MYIFGGVFLMTAILIYFFKNEHSPNNLEEIAKDAREDNVEAQKLSIFHAYKVIWSLLKLKSVRGLALVLLTANVFARFVFCEQKFSSDFIKCFLLLDRNRR
jgi:hypothetical protein